MDPEFDFRLPAPLELLVWTYKCDRNEVNLALLGFCAAGELGLARALVRAFPFAEAAERDAVAQAGLDAALTAALRADRLRVAGWLWWAAGGRRAGTSGLGRLLREACAEGRLGAACWAAGALGLGAAAAEPGPGRGPHDAADQPALRLALRGRRSGPARWLGARFGFGPARAGPDGAALARAAGAGGSPRLARWLWRAAGPWPSGPLLRGACAEGRLGAACWAAGALGLAAEAAASEGPPGEDCHAIRAALCGQNLTEARWLGARFGFTRADAVRDQDDSDEDG